MTERSMFTLRRSTIYLLIATAMVLFPIGSTNAYGIDRQTGADMCQYMPPGGTHYLTTDTYCQHHYPRGGWWVHQRYDLVPGEHAGSMPPGQG